MKNIYILGLLWACSSWAIAADTTTNTVAPLVVQVTTRPEIMGLWGMEIPNNKQCVEYYNFRSANDVVIKSGQEWSSGLYDYQPSADQKEQLSALVMQIKYDNNGKDCSGMQVDQTGEMSQYFVKWTDQHTINFCTNKKGEQCFATLHKVLP